MIRADREAYYYGKGTLFRVHPDLIEILCRLAPHLLSNVFDGLMWHSRNIIDGHRRVNYYIKDVYGNPEVETYQDSFATPMADLTRLHRSDVFTHPFVLFLLDLKWVQYARNMYLQMQLLYIFTLIFFMLGYVILDVETDAAFGCRCVSVFLSAVSLLYYQLWRITLEIRKHQLIHSHFVLVSTCVFEETNELFEA